MSSGRRSERDLLGEREVPGQVYWGIHTLRAIENFQISGTPISAYPDLVNGLAAVKEAAALTNRDLGLLDPEASRCNRSSLRGDPRREAARPIRGGRDSRRRRNFDEYERERGHR